MYAVVRGRIEDFAKPAQLANNAGVQPNLIGEAKGQAQQDYHGIEAQQDAWEVENPPEEIGNKAHPVGHTKVVNGRAVVNAMVAPNRRTSWPMRCSQ